MNRNLNLHCMTCPNVCLSLVLLFATAFGNSLSSVYKCVCINRDKHIFTYTHKHWHAQICVCMCVCSLCPSSRSHHLRPRKLTNFENSGVSRIAPLPQWPELYPPSTQTNLSVGSCKKKHRQPWKNPLFWLSQWGCYPRFLVGGSYPVKKVSHMGRLPWKFDIIERYKRWLLHAESPVPARGIWAIRPEPVNCCEITFCFYKTFVCAHLTF